jgi:hypothetical protein
VYYFRLTLVRLLFCNNTSQYTLSSSSLLTLSDMSEAAVCQTAEEKVGICGPRHVEPGQSAAQATPPPAGPGSAIRPPTVKGLIIMAFNAIDLMED